MDKALNAAFDYLDATFKAHGTTSFTILFYFHAMEQKGYDRPKAEAALEQVMAQCRPLEKEYQVSVYIDERGSTVIVVTAISHFEEKL